MRPGVFWGVLGYPWVSWGILGCPGVIRPTRNFLNERKKKRKYLAGPGIKHGTSGS